MDNGVKLIMTDRELVALSQLLLNNPSVNDQKKIEQERRAMLDA